MAGQDGFKKLWGLLPDSPISASVRYQAAWNEICTREAVRENMMIGYIVASATMIGLASKIEDLRLLALIVPYMAAAVSLILYNHENVISQMELYLRDLAEAADIVRDWFHPVSINEGRAGRRRGLGFRTRAIYAVMVGSSVSALLVSMSEVKSVPSVWIGGARWFGGWIAVAFSIFCIYKGRTGLRGRVYQ